MRHSSNLIAIVAAVVPCLSMAATVRCDKSCLEGIGDRYRNAYVKHDPSLAPIAKSVRFSENNVSMQFPDASWDTITQETGPALTLSDPRSGNVGIYTTIMQNDTPGFLAIRLKVVAGKITEIEHILSTKRNLSGPPTPIGDVKEFSMIRILRRRFRPSSAYRAQSSCLWPTGISPRSSTTMARSVARDFHPTRPARRMAKSLARSRRASRVDFTLSIIAYAIVISSSSMRSEASS